MSRKKLKKGETKRGIGPAGGAPVSEATGKVFTGHKGTKRGVGPAGGAPVSEATGEVFTGQGKEVPTSDLPQSGQITMQGNKKSQNRIT
jgi:hypothetical protein